MSPSDSEPVPLESSQTQSIGSTALESPQSVTRATLNRAGSSMSASEISESYESPVPSPWLEASMSPGTQGGSVGASIVLPRVSNSCELEQCRCRCVPMLRAHAARLIL